MKIQFINLDRSDKKATKEIRKVVLDILSRKAFILGDEVQQLEKQFADYCQTKYAVGVSSGTAALFLSLKALDIAHGDGVITTPFTFTATGEVIAHCGATPIFIDIDEKTYNIDPGKIESCIKKIKTQNNKVTIKAVIPVHLYGQPADMSAIVDIAKKYNLKVIEDAAQSHGARCKMNNGQWQRVGSIGDFGCFSFYPTKNLGAYGDAGMITTNDENLYSKVLQLRNHGRVEHYLHQRLGFNARLDNIQAGVLLVKFKYIEEWNRERQELARMYTESLKGVGDIITPEVSSNTEHVYHLYVIRTKYRDGLAAFLKENGVMTAVQYGVPLHLQPAYKDICVTDGHLEVVERISKEVLSLPLYPGLKEKEVDFVVKKIRKFFRDSKHTKVLKINH